MSDEGARLRIPSDRLLSGRYTVTFDVGSGLAEAAVAEVRRAVTLLCAAATRGAFPAAGAAPHAARLQIVGARLAPPSQVIFEVQATGIDAYGFELLRNMTDRLARRDIEVREIAVSPDGERRERLKPVPGDVTEFDLYPPPCQLRFPTFREPLDDSRLRRCVTELKQPVEALHLDRLGDCSSTWFELLEAGAYSMPVGPAWETDCVGGAATIFDEFSVEISVNRFQASECAWYALLNMLDACWNDSLIAMVTIE